MVSLNLYAVNLFSKLCGWLKVLVFGNLLKHIASVAFDDRTYLLFAAGHGSMFAWISGPPLYLDEIAEENVNPQSAITQCSVKCSAIPECFGFSATDTGKCRLFEMSKAHCDSRNSVTNIFYKQ